MGEPDTSDAPPSQAKRPASWSLLGPLFRYDLVAASRRGQHTILRCVAAIVLLLTLYFGYSLNVPGFDVFRPFVNPPAMHVDGQAKFANWFFQSSLVVQLVLMFLLAPTLIADTIARDKERRTLEFLFITELSDWEIVVGKLGSRLTYLLGVLLAAIPVLSLTQLFGGVAIEHLIFGYVSLLSSLFVLGALSMYCSIVSETATGATATAYAVAIAYGLLSICCLTGSLSVSVGWSQSAVIAMANGFLGIITLRACVHDLRPRAGGVVQRPRPGARGPAVVRLTKALAARSDGPAHPAKPPPVRPPLPPPARAPRPGSPHSAIRAPLPPVDENWPLLWKEVCHRRPGWGEMPDWKSALAILLIPVFPALFYVIKVPDELRIGIAEFARYVASFMVVLLGGFLALIVVRHTSGSVTRERELDTLAGLLTLPVHRDEILAAKWLAAFVAWWPLPILIAGLIIFAVASGSTSIGRAFVVTVSLAASIEFLASLGLWISVLCRTTLRASLFALFAVMMVGSGPFIVTNYIEMASPGTMTTERVDLIMTAGMPPYTWSRVLAGGNRADSMTAKELNAVLWSSLVYAVAAWVLWRDASRRFARFSG